MGSKARGIIIMGGLLNEAVEVHSDNWAAGGLVGISVGPAPSNNRLKLAVRGRRTPESRSRSRTAA